MLLILFFYYFLVWKYIKNSEEIIDCDNYIKNSKKIFKKDKNEKIKSKKIKEIRDMLERILNSQKSENKNFSNTKENIFDKCDEYEIKPYHFKQGDVIYAFTIDKINAFQEGIISENYNSSDTHSLPVSIKGKNNKIFFNTEGNFVGFSLPNQDEQKGINYVVTSNCIFYFFQCHKCYEDKQRQEEEEEEQKYKDKEEKKIQNLEKNNYYLPIKIKKKENDTIIKRKISFDQKGNYLGIFKNSSKKSKYISLEKLYKKMRAEIDKQRECNKCQEILKKQYENQQLNEEKKQKDINEKIIEDLNTITFVIFANKSLGQDSLGSGFICKVEQVQEKKENEKQKYKYYILTNRHVIKTDDNPNAPAIMVLNKYFEDSIKNIKILGYIDNENDYDDIAILEFENDDEKKYTKIKKILDERMKNFYPEEKKMKIKKGDFIYNMGSQLAQIIDVDLDPKENYIIRFFYENGEILVELLDQPKKSIKKYLEINLLKKGNIVFFNEKEINFDIKIDNGNSGGPVFDEKGMIIGMNKSSVENPVMTDQFSQAINITHINDIYQKITNKKKQNPIPTKFIFKDDDFQQEKEEKINQFISNSDLNSFLEKQKDITFSIKDLFYILKNKSESKILLFPSSFNNKNIQNEQINLFLIKIYDDQKQIFCFNPKYDQIEIEFKAKNEKKIKFFFRKKNNNIIIEEKEYLFKNSFKYNPFLSFRIMDKKQNDLLSKSLVIWEKDNKNVEGNGVIFQKKTLSNGNFLYFILSTHKNNLGLFFLPFYKKIEPLVNLLSDKVNIILSNIEGSNSKERGVLKSFYYGNYNLSLITFESSVEYPITPIRKLSDSDISEDIYYITNTDNKNHFPQIFKGNVSFIENENFLFDSVFDLKTKNTFYGQKINFLCFDKNGNFLGINHFISNNEIPHNFIKASFIKGEIIKELLMKEKWKNNIQIIYFVFFIIITSFIIIFILPIKNIYSYKVKKL